MYDPTIGRFLSEDPSGLEPDENPYRYVKNAATMAVDPTGLLTIYVWPQHIAANGEISWGHTSIMLEDGTYISWWPEDTFRDPYFPDFSYSWLDDLYTAHSIPRTYDEDNKDEDSIAPHRYYVDPNDIYEPAIRDWWLKYKDDRKNEWSTIGNNCCTIVAEALRQGGWRVLEGFWFPARVEKACEKHPKVKPVEAK